MTLSPAMKARATRLLRRQEAENETAILRERLAAALGEVHALRAYLLGPKFQGDGNDYVHVRTDLLHRLDSVSAAIKFGPEA